jgi:hypothetical protein
MDALCSKVGATKKNREERREREQKEREGRCNIVEAGNMAS